MLLSVLDQSPIAEGSTGAQALHNTLDLAGSPISSAITATGWPSTTAARCWPGPSPEVLIGPIASATEHIRVGSGGVMLPHYSPLKVAESFTILAALYPGRIDLGLGRAAGTDPLTTFALQRDRRQAAPTTSPSSWPSCWPTSRTPCPTIIPSGTWPPRCPAARSCRCRGCSGPRRRARSGPPSWDCPTPSRTSSTRRQRDRHALPRALQPGARPPGAPHRGGGVGAVRAHRRGGRAPGVEQPDDVDAAAARPADRRPATGQGGGVPGPRGPGGPAAHPRAGGRSSARPRRCGPRSRRWPRTTAPRR